LLSGAKEKGTRGSFETIWSERYYG
jgi:hypothetical protein